MSNQHTKAITLLETLNRELGSVIKNAFHENRQYLLGTEIEHLVKMTDYTVFKIKQQVKVPHYQ